MADTNRHARGMELAMFAGGCFWCMVTPFEEMPGIGQVISGYSGGTADDPRYELVKSGVSGHREVVLISYDPALFPYERLLEIYWQQIDPTDAEGQFIDRGTSYTTAIFYYTEEQRIKAEASKSALAASGRFTRPIVTEILPAATFYPAEEEHQSYHRKHPEAYKRERETSGRDDFIKRHWT